MSRELVTVRTVDAVDPIAGADAIEVATFGGWRIVVGRGAARSSTGARSTCCAPSRSAACCRTASCCPRERYRRPTVSTTSLPRSECGCTSLPCRPSCRAPPGACIRRCSRAPPTPNACRTWPRRIRRWSPPSGMRPRRSTAPPPPTSRRRTACGCVGGTTNGSPPRT
ncbi:hypothetical protein [Tsukamurella soli]|uniref:hypothetical protein n=1 Tax=Tsukamurella soli TaxID=644556 RepID=UPI003CD0BA65